MNKLSTIKEVLIERDGMSPSEAQERIDEAIDHLDELLEEDDLSGAFEICADHFGLEMDYLIELLV